MILAGRLARFFFCFPTYLFYFCLCKAIIYYLNLFSFMSGRFIDRVCDSMSAHDFYKQHPYDVHGNRIKVDDLVLIKGDLSREPYSGKVVELSENDGDADVVVLVNHTGKVQSFSPYDLQVVDLRRDFDLLDAFYSYISTSSIKVFNDFILALGNLGWDIEERGTFYRAHKDFSANGDMRASIVYGGPDTPYLVYFDGDGWGFLSGESQPHRYIDAAVTFVDSTAEKV